MKEPGAKIGFPVLSIVIITEHYTADRDQWISVYSTAEVYCRKQRRINFISADLDHSRHRHWMVAGVTLTRPLSLSCYAEHDHYQVMDGPEMLVVTPVILGTSD